jgi:hypothetical protein
MVIANSDSTGTLVSLDDETNNKGMTIALGSSPTSIAFETSSSSSRERGFVKTCISVPEVKGLHSQSTLILPQLSDVDTYLQYHPSIVDRAYELLSQSPVEYTAQSRERILYVSQGEIAHAVSLQTDILVSDRATTCHILAWRSCSDSNVLLATLTHLDGTTYEKCLRKAMAQHVHHHNGSPMQVDLHIVGGYCDSHGTSVSITNWLLPLLADLSAEYQDIMTMSLQTCAVSALNDNGWDSPTGRGLAMDVRTGRVHVAHCESSVMGPMTTLRSVRLWSAQGHAQLTCVHSHQSNVMVIPPFQYQPFESLDALLALPDDVFLKYTSTSPECEEADFVPQVRKTLTFLRTTPWREAFPHFTCLVFRRAGSSNVWKAA